MNFKELVNKVKNDEEAICLFEDTAASVGIDINFDSYLQLLEEYIAENRKSGKMDMMINILLDRIEKGQTIMDIVGIDKISKKQFAEVFTPTWLVDDMLDKLPEEVWSNPDLKWIDNSCGSGVFLWHGVVPRLKRGLKDQFDSEKDLNKHIAKMIHGVDIQASNIGICRKYLLNSLGKENKRTIIKNIVKANSLEFDYWNGKKFDIVVGNPPYQDDSGNKGRGHTLWTQFIEMNFYRILKEDGYLVYVHPSLWRQVNHEIGDILKNKNMLYLEIHGVEDCNKTFGATTRYDWYVCQNNEKSGNTIVKGQDGKVENVKLSDWEFVPNMMFKKVKSLLGSGIDTCEVICDRSNYGADKKWVNKEQNSTFKYPCFYYIPKDKEASFRWSSRNDRGHFGVPKVIFCSGVYKSVDCFVDTDGNYGMTQWCGAIVEEKKNLKNLYKALRSEEFIKLIDAVSISKTEMNAKVLKLFRKDFWKDFI
jgi:hypothetical protein